MKPQGRWSSKFTFIMAASAAAIGLGNIWRFPYLAGQHGGAIFVLLYLLFVIVLGLPLLIAEIVLGRSGRGSPYHAMENIAVLTKLSKHWRIIGGISIAAGYLILTYYSVISGWVLDYFVRSLVSLFNGTTITHHFNQLLNNPWEMLASDTIIMLGVIVTVSLGIKGGIERVIKFIFPALFLLLLLLLIYAMQTPGFHQAVNFLFKPDLQKITSKTMLLALGQAFFSLNVAMGITMMFSAYLPKKVPIISSAIAIAIADTVIALLAGLIIFPIAFSNHLQPGSGPGLIFRTLPIAFAQMPWGNFIASLFFLMLELAAFSSAIALIEPTVAWMMQRFNCKRLTACLVTGIMAWILSIGTIISFNVGKNFDLFGMNFYQLIDFITSDIMLPVGGLLIAIFTGWFLKRSIINEQLTEATSRIWILLWRFILRYLAPLCIVLILLGALGLMKV